MKSGVFSRLSVDRALRELFILQYRSKLPLGIILRHQLKTLVASADDLVCDAPAQTTSTPPEAGIARRMRS